MNENSNPLDYILKCSEQGMVPKLFTVQNAKDELKRLRQELESYRNLAPVAWGKINSRGDLYDLRTQDNRYISDDACVPLYSNKAEFKDFFASFRNK
jgi:hypothetical protein